MSELAGKDEAGAPDRDEEAGSREDDGVDDAAELSGSAT